MEVAENSNLPAACNWCSLADTRPLLFFSFLKRKTLFSSISYHKEKKNLQLFYTTKFENSTCNYNSCYYLYSTCTYNSLVDVFISLTFASVKSKTIFETLGCNWEKIAINLLSNLHNQHNICNCHILGNARRLILLFFPPVKNENKLQFFFQTP